VVNLSYNILLKRLGCFMRKYYPLGTNITQSPQPFYGGHRESAFHPHITGYFFVFFELPKAVFDGNTKILEDLLLSTCTDAQEPDAPLEFGKIPGLGGVNINVITKSTISDSISFTFTEVNGKRIYNIFQHWRSCQSPTFGIYNKVGMKQSDYKGMVTVVKTKPTSDNGQFTLKDIVASNQYHGLIVQSIPTGDANIESNDIEKVTVTLTFDGAPIPDMNLGLSLMNQYSVKLRASTQC
jgi:hypothetical protein